MSPPSARPLSPRSRRASAELPFFGVFGRARSFCLTRLVIAAVGGRCARPHRAEAVRQWRRPTPTSTHRRRRRRCAHVMSRASPLINIVRRRAPNRRRAQCLEWPTARTLLFSAEAPERCRQAASKLWADELAAGATRSLDQRVRAAARRRKPSSRRRRADQAHSRIARQSADSRDARDLRQSRQSAASFIDRICAL